MLTYVVRYILTGMMIYFSYLETGVYTAVILSLIAISIEVQTLRLSFLVAQLKKEIYKWGLLYERNK